MNNLYNPYIEFKMNPLNKMTQEYTNTINNWKLVIEEKYEFTVKVQNPQLPKLYGLPKIQKPGNNMSPIVTNINAPTYDLAKYLVKTLYNTF